jgi:MFS family permease
MLVMWVSYFALYGFIFLITQYFQVVRGWGTLSAGLRFLPVALTIAIGSVAGAALSQRVGTRRIVVIGLVMFGGAFAWIGLSATFVSYWQIVGQEILLGLGLGLTSTPATESILSVLPPARTGVGSAVNDATRVAGGTLGVAVIGSVFTSIYVHGLGSTAFAGLPGGAGEAAKSSVVSAVGTVAQANGSLHTTLLNDFNDAFMSGLHAACIVGVAVCWIGAIGALALPGRRSVEPVVAARFVTRTAPPQNPTPTPTES